MRKIRRREPRPRLLKRQRDVLCDVMLSAGTCETWLTLVELSRLTQYGEASISAQLRTCGSRSTARLWWRSGAGRWPRYARGGARAGLGVPFAARDSQRAAADENCRRRRLPGRGGNDLRRSFTGLTVLLRAPGPCVGLAIYCGEMAIRRAAPIRHGESDERKAGDGV